MPDTARAVLPHAAWPDAAEPRVALRRPVRDPIAQRYREATAPVFRDNANA